MTWEDIQTLQPPVLMINVGSDFHTLNTKGGEPFEDVWERAREFRHLIFQAYAGANILDVSHGVFLQMFHGILRGLSCIEYLGTYPSNLDLAKFQFVSQQLIDEKVTTLLGSEPFKWQYTGRPLFDCDVATVSNNHRHNQFLRLCMRPPITGENQ